MYMLVGEHGWAVSGGVQSQGLVGEMLARGSLSATLPRKGQARLEKESEGETMVLEGRLRECDIYPPSEQLGFTEPPAWKCCPGRKAGKLGRHCDIGETGYGEEGA